MCGCASHAAVAWLDQDGDTGVREARVLCGGAVGKGERRQETQGRRPDEQEGGEQHDQVSLVGVRADPQTTAPEDQQVER